MDPQIATATTHSLFHHHPVRPAWNVGTMLVFGGNGDLIAFAWENRLAGIFKSKSLAS